MFLCVQKEPLARVLRERPFENAEYLEILFPDVVASGGQPKRVTKPKRKGPDNIPGGEAPPGTSIMRLANGPAVVGTNNAGATPMRNNVGITPNMNSTPVPVPSNTTPQARQQAGSSVTQANAGVQIRGGLQGNVLQGQGQGQGQGPVQTPSIQPPPPVSQGAGGLRQVGGIARVGNPSALTPPDDINGTGGSNNASVVQGQKRFAPGTDGATQAATTKRRRTDGGINTNSANRNRAEPQANVTNVAAAAAGVNSQQNAAGPRLSSMGDGIMGAGGRQQQAGGAGAPTGGGGGSVRADGITNLLGDVLSKYASAATLASTTRWPEQAMEIFFQEFADEDMDLQLRIAEKILTDTSKAVMFCKMPATLRKHWVKRLREAISRQGN